MTDLPPIERCPDCCCYHIHLHLNAKAPCVTVRSIKERVKYAKMMMEAIPLGNTQYLSIIGIVDKAFAGLDEDER